MRILFLVNHDVVIYNFRLELVERLLDDGHEVYISSPYGERIDDLVALGCVYKEIDLSRHGVNLVSELKLILTYQRLIRCVRPDIVFTYTIKPNIYGSMASRALSVPCVANITGLGTAVEKQGIMQKLTLLLYAYAFRDIQRVFFQNTVNMQFFADHKIALGKHMLLPGSGVNLQRFHPLAYPSDETIEFAFISRIMKEKGIDQFLDAAKAIRIKYPNTRFHVCGFCEEDYEHRLRRLNAEGVIIYHGMVRDIRTILKHTHCTVHPSFYPEGLSNILLESAACARPIITTDRPGCRECLIDGKTGFMIPMRDTNALIDAIIKFVEMPWEAKMAMGYAGRAKIQAEFDKKIVVEAYMKEITACQTS